MNPHLIDAQELLEADLSRVRRRLGGDRGQYCDLGRRIGLQVPGDRNRLHLQVQVVLFRKRDEKRSQPVQKELTWRKPVTIVLMSVWLEPSLGSVHASWSRNGIWRSVCSISVQQGAIYRGKEKAHVKLLDDLACVVCEVVQLLLSIGRRTRDGD